MWCIGSSIGCHQNAQVGDISMQCYDWKEFTRRASLGGPRCERQTLLVLMYVHTTDDSDLLYSDWVQGEEICISMAMREWVHPFRSGNTGG